MPKKQCTRCKNWKACRKLTAKTHDWCYSLFYLEGFPLNADQSICLCNRCWFYLCNEKTRTGVQSENENTNDSNAMDTSVHEDQDQDQDQDQNQNQDQDQDQNQNQNQDQDQDQLTIENIFFFRLKP
ncbi:unnamed protein product [Rotaria magnacalcarata]|uniref:Uncharacterized protein n=1 Tax=Rotaria magnacalcarata TaxID=392030 RepID=A0A816YKC7_9BILA|nr:unnamed protein product [Rotaria magnacalcarata]CAF4272903.1 unnamed protein product [Rotaria magnacalcarata]